MTIPEIKALCQGVIKLGEYPTKGPWIPSVWGTQILTGDSWQTVCVFYEAKNDHRLAEWEDGVGKAKHNSANADFIATARSFTPQAAKALLLAIDGLGDIANSDGDPHTDESAEYWAKERSSSAAREKLNEICKLFP
jgi:hypothetical protein